MDHPVMRIRLVIVLLTLTVAPHPLAAQEAATGPIQGRVVDAETGEPLAGAHVFLAGSVRGTTSDTEGYYHLEGLPPGVYEVAASMLGFETRLHRLTHAAPNPSVLDFRLQPTVIALGEVVVAAEKPENWHAYLARFQELFLGTTANAERCLLVNPTTLDFIYDEESGQLRAMATEPLVIENRALGYRVYYHLQEFEALEGWVRYLGTSRFEELEPRNRRERRRWERRRRKAYEGSLQHFLSMLFDDGTAKAARSAGFDVSMAPRFETDPTLAVPVRAEAFLKPAPQPYTRLLAFDKHLLVIYKPDIPPSAPSGVPGATPQLHVLDDYASWITLNDGPAEVDPLGHLYNPYAVTTFGLWSRERLADLLPRDYRPE